MDYLRCSECFADEGLKLTAFRLGQEIEGSCISCGSESGRKLVKATLVNLAAQFFVKGSYVKTKYGGASKIEFNENHSTNVMVSDHLKNDLKIFENDLGVGFFYYGPPMWMIGEIEPLKDLNDSLKRKAIINHIFENYQTVTLSNFDFYRIRINPTKPQDSVEYDAPPNELKKKFTRLDSLGLSVLYGSFDIPTCLHECRVSYEDDIYVATLSPSQSLKLLDLNQILDEDLTPFESLDIAVAMLFGATSHSYEICQDVAKEAFLRGFDGIIYPSYYTELQSGVERFGTSYGLPLRKLPQFRTMLQGQIYPNVAIFGHPICGGKVKIKCINRIYLNRVEYDFGFGPVV